MFADMRETEGNEKYYGVDVLRMTKVHFAFTQFLAVFSKFEF